MKKNTEKELTDMATETIDKFILFLNLLQVRYQNSGDKLKQVYGTIVIAGVLHGMAEQYYDELERASKNIGKAGKEAMELVELFRQITIDSTASGHIMKRIKRDEK